MAAPSEPPDMEEVGASAGLCFGAVFAINEARRFADLHRKLVSETSKGRSLKWVALGRFDHLLLNLAHETEELLRPEKSVHFSKEASGHWSYYGRFLRKEAFDWEGAFDRNGVAAISAIRAVSRLGALTRKEECQHLIAKLESTFADLDLEWNIGTTTGWDDYLVFFFSRGFGQISQAIARLRGLTSEEVVAEPLEGLHRHWLLTSCTLPLLRLDWPPCLDVGLNEADDTATDSLLSRIDADDPISWAVRFELRPGHWNGFFEELHTRANSVGINIVATKVFGQVDLRCAHPDGTLGSLAKFLSNVAFPLVCEEGTLIRSMETHLHLPADQYLEDPTAPSSATQRQSPHSLALVSLFDETLQRKCRDHGLPQHTIDTILNTFRRIEAFGQHDLLAEEFSTMEEVCQHFVAGIRKLADPTEAGMRSLQSEITDWLMYVERCLSDRYRGLYPTGENMIMRLGTYQASHQRFLTLADRLARCAVDLATFRVEERLRESGLQRLSFGTIAIANCLGNSPTPWSVNSLRYFATGFIDLPVSLVFHPRHSVMLAHETGHHFTKAYLHWNPDVRVFQEGGIDELVYKLGNGNSEREASLMALRSNGERKVDRQVTEILADLFSCCFCSKGDVGKHLENTEAAINHIYPPQSAGLMAKSVMIEHSLRLTAVGEIIKLFEGSYSIFEHSGVNRMEEVFLANPDHEIILREAERNSNVTLARAQEHSAEIAQALRAFDLLVEIPSFRAFLAGIVDLARKELPERCRGAKLIRAYRDFMASERVSLSADLAALDAAWCLAVEEP
jgi:hypothetical protein